VDVIGSPGAVRWGDGKAQVDGRALDLVARGAEKGEGEVDAFPLAGPALGFGACSPVVEVGFQLCETGQHLGV
jgi:hypothetical protein